MNAFTVDLEDWFHILGEGCEIPMTEWDALEARVEANTARLLELLDERGVRATFFVLGWIADRYPALVREISGYGHEIASHGWHHQLIFNQSVAEFRDDVSRSKRLLEDIAGSEVIGYRAPGFSLTRETLWALDVLREEGYLYDSSFFPARRGHGGMPDGPSAPQFLDCPGGGRIFEFPVSVLELLGYTWPYSGGGYLRATPLWVTKWAVSRANARLGRPVVMYLHPREVDPDQPRLTNLPWKRHLKYYWGLEGTSSKVDDLLDRFEYGKMCDLYRSHAENAAISR